jgi:hypothetical protein
MLSLWQVRRIAIEILHGSTLYICHRQQRDSVNTMTQKTPSTHRPPNFSLLLTIALVAILMVAAMSIFQLLEALIG